MSETRRGSALALDASPRPRGGRAREGVRAERGGIRGATPHQHVASLVLPFRPSTDCVARNKRLPGGSISTAKCFAAAVQR